MAWYMEDRRKMALGSLPAKARTLISAGPLLHTSLLPVFCPLPVASAFSSPSPTRALLLSRTYPLGARVIYFRGFSV